MSGETASNRTRRDTPTAIVCGASGFIGGHLVYRLKSEGYWVRAVSSSSPRYRPSVADEFLILDLRDPQAAQQALAGVHFDELYQFAANMGGMEFIGAAECPILSDSVRINVNLVENATRAGVGRYFFASSVCVYRDMAPGEAALSEEDAYPALPNNEYGWEKLYSERLLQAYSRHHGLEARIARFENTYGPYGPWRGGREKAVAALSRKVAMVPDGGTIDVFGDGSAIRAYTYIDDLIGGIRLLMESDSPQPTNIGTSEYVTVNQLVDTIRQVSGKRFSVRHIPGPVGVRSRNFSKKAIEALGYQTRYSLADGVRATYTWIKELLDSGIDGRDGATHNDEFAVARTS